MRNARTARELESVRTDRGDAQLPCERERGEVIERIRKPVVAHGAFDAVKRRDRFADVGGRDEGCETLRSSRAAYADRDGGMRANPPHDRPRRTVQTLRDPGVGLRPVVRDERIDAYEVVNTRSSLPRFPNPFSYVERDASAGSGRRAFESLDGGSQSQARVVSSRDRCANGCEFRRARFERVAHVE